MMRKTNKNKPSTQQHQQLANILNHANTLLEIGKFDEAIANYQLALSIDPNFAEAYNNMGVALQQLGKLDEAIECHQRALKIKPNYTQAFQNLGLAFNAQGKLSSSFENYQRALLLESSNADLHFNLGILFNEQNSFNEAVKSFQQALKLNPNLVEAHHSLGDTFKKQGQLSAAIKSYQQALLINPDFAPALDELVLAQMQCCDWTNYLQNTTKIIQAVSQGEQQYRPFAFLAISDSAANQLQCAQAYAALRYPQSQTPLWAGQRYKHNKIRIAYISADFHNHATAYLITGLFEKHDKKRFEITAISLGHRNNGDMRERLQGAFDRFIDVHNMDDLEVANLLQRLEIDIAIDLKGYTEESRPGIFAYRAVPIQVNYLGYPSTMGAAYIDYILADIHVISPEHQAYYLEKTVYLPDTYQVNDSKRPISEYTPTRAEANLPETSFVFCCFNNNYKITPKVFDSWMRLLTKVENSVLWLLEDNFVAAFNLKKEAGQRGIAAERLIFASRVKLDKHLARHKLADLFLDTLPYNAHTTASDALWAGLPVLTCMGNAFAGRVAGSLLNAVGLPELVTHSFEEYEALAFKLATTPALLADIRTKLANNRSTYPLFDTDRFRRHIESAYTTMWERHQRGKPPIGFAVLPIE